MFFKVGKGDKECTIEISQILGVVSRWTVKPKVI